MDILELNNRLLQGVLIAETDSFPTFEYVKSVFSDRQYNFIIPKTDPKSFDWQKAAEIIEAEKRLRINFSYYIRHGGYYEGLADELKRRGAKVVMIDLYPVKQMMNLFEETSCESTLVSEDLQKKYVEVSAACFPDWSNNDEFCQRLFKSQAETSDKKVANYLIRKNGAVVGIYSAISSTDLNLSYMTNMGTLPEFRGQGIQKEVTKLHCNWCLENKVSRVYAIVEPESVSLHNFEKLGFQIEESYDAFFIQE